MACRSLIVATLLIACSSASASTEAMSSSYAGQESREIKAGLLNFEWAKRHGG